MKRTMVVVVGAVVSLLILSLSASAQNPMGTGGTMMGGSPAMTGQPGTRVPYCPGPRGMMGAFMDRTVVATSDGGVVVLAGEKLMKFDKNLNLVKEIEVKFDTAAMDAWMQQMMHRYGGSWGWRGRGGRGPGQRMPPPNQ
jgi:hypothetical protein